jgi:hypothetical protein
MAALQDLGAFNPRGAFAAATNYNFKDLYTSAGVAYVTLEGHTSTNVAADLAAGKVAVYQGVVPGSIVADSFSTNPADIDDIVALLNVATLTNPGFTIDGGVIGGGWPRNDAAIGIRSPASGTPGQRHALIVFDQPHTDDEWGIVGYHTIPTLGQIQTSTFFNALEHRSSYVSGVYDDAANFCGYAAFHGVSAYGDVVPMVMYYDNRMEVLCDIIGSPAVFNRGLTERHVFHNFQNTYLQGWTVMGQHSQSRRDQNILEINGPLFIGTVDGTTFESTRGGQFFFHVPSGKFFIQAYRYDTAALDDMMFSAKSVAFTLTTKPALGAVGSDAATTQALANAMRTALINYGLATA